MTRPLESFSDQDILLAAMAMNRGIKVSGERPGKTDTMTQLLGDLLNQELVVRAINSRRMAEELFDRLLNAVAHG